MQCPATSLASLMLCYSYFDSGCHPPHTDITVDADPESPFPYLKTTFALQGGFFDRPRTERDAKDEGWTQLSSCEEKDIQFPGNRYGVSSNPDDIVLIYDKKGSIAGVQAVVDFSKTDEQYYNFEASPYFVRGDYKGHDVYYLTAYFVEPYNICRGGRGKRRLREEGTIQALYFQSGPTPDNRVSIPLTNEAMENEAELFGWNEVVCWPPMGKHFIIFDNYNLDIDCKSLMPFTAIYNNGRLSGFVYNIVAEALGEKYEIVNANTLPVLLPAPDLIPPCLLNQVINNFPISAMHVYFQDNFTNCTDAKFPLIT